VALAALRHAVFAPESAISQTSRETGRVLNRSRLEISETSGADAMVKHAKTLSFCTLAMRIKSRRLGIRRCS
jgi:hypothetical protein